MIKTESIVRVGISDLNIVRSPNTIRTSGLGSCVGIVIYDLSNEIAGLSHIMLPDSSLTKQTNLNEYKFADTAIPLLINKLLLKGAKKRSLQAKIAGGAQMFQFAATSDVMRIGPRNVEAVKENLTKHHIPLVASDVGGNSGRTIEFNPASGTLNIRTVNKEEKHI